MAPLRRILANRFLRDSSVLQAGSLSISGLAFLGTIALTHVLGAHRQGEYYLAVAAYSLLWFCLNLGLYPVTISQVAQRLTSGDREGALSWLAYLFKSGIPLGILTLLVGVWGLPSALSWWTSDPSANVARIGLCASILSISPLLELPRVVALAGLEGSRRMLAVTRIENAQEVLRVVLVVIGALLTGSGVGPVIGTVCASALGSLVALVVFQRERLKHVPDLPSMGEILRAAVRVPWTLGLRLGIKMGIVRNIDALAVQVLPALVLGHFSSPQWVSYLRIAQRLVDVSRMFMKGISRTALPVLSGLAQVRDRAGLRRVYWRATLGSGFLFAGGLGLSALILPWAMETFLPRDFHHPVWMSFLILLPGTAVSGFSVANDTFYLVTNQLRMAIILSVVGLVVNTGVLFLACSRWPDYGAAVGLSFTFLWSLTHVAYAGWWFRKHRKQATPA